MKVILLFPSILYLAYGFDRGLYGHDYLYDFNLKVPLILFVPGKGQPTRRIPDQVGLVDVLPTVMELAGMALPSYLDGRSLVPLLARRLRKRF